MLSCQKTIIFLPLQPGTSKLTPVPDVGHVNSIKKHELPGLK